MSAKIDAAIVRRANRMLIRGDLEKASEKYRSVRRDSSVKIVDVRVAMDMAVKKTFQRGAE